MKEMKHVRPAFKPWDGSVENVQHNLRTYLKIRCQMIFDVKIDFNREARLVAGGHTTETSTDIFFRCLERFGKGNFTHGCTQ